MEQRRACCTLASCLQTLPSEQQQSELKKARATARAFFNLFVRGVVLYDTAGLRQDGVGVFAALEHSARSCASGLTIDDDGLSVHEHAFDAVGIGSES